MNTNLKTPTRLNPAITNPFYAVAAIVSTGLQLQMVSEPLGVKIIDYEQVTKINCLRKNDLRNNLITSTLMPIDTSFFFQGIETTLQPELLEDDDVYVRLNYIRKFKIRATLTINRTLPKIFQD